jgi:hypothetical protein
LGEHHLEIDRRAFLTAILASAAAGALGSACAPAPTIASARHTLMGLWDAVVPGVHDGVVEDWLSAGHPAPGAGQGGVQDWIEDMAGSLPPPLDYVTDWFLRAWAADLDLWADVFHPPIDDGAPSFGDLPLGPTFAERGRQYKIMLMMGLFDGVIELQYLGGLLLAKLAFYADFWAERSGAPRVGSEYIGFRGPVGDQPIADFTFGIPAGRHDDRLAATPGGLVCVP